MTNHPFAGAKGAAIRDRFAASLYVDQAGRCKMCGTMIDATLRGTRSKQAAVIDHIRPWKLDPDNRYSQDACQLICRSCHGICDSIEQRHWPDADRIAAEKAAHRPVGLDGYPIA